MKACLIFFFACSVSQAATYYISTSGNDANNGTATSTPWRSQPYMATFSGTYSHSAGDKFIFKGGDTWTNGYFPMTVTEAERLVESIIME